MSPGFITCLKSFLRQSKLTFHSGSKPRVSPLRDITSGMEGLNVSSGHEEFTLTSEELKQIAKELCYQSVSLSE